MIYKGPYLLRFFRWLFHRRPQEDKYSGGWVYMSPHGRGGAVDIITYDKDAKMSFLTDWPVEDEIEVWVCPDGDDDPRSFD